MSTETEKIHIQLTKITEQINRLVSDAESEKETKKERNRTMDERLAKLEVFKTISETTAKNTNKMFRTIGFLTGVIISLVGLIVAYLSLKK